MKKIFAVISLALFAMAAAPLCAAPGQKAKQLEPCIEIELNRIAETYNLLDTYARKVWPGWDNYMKIQFKTQFPNLVFMIVNPQGDVPKGYELVPGRTINGCKVYLNRTEQLPGTLEPPLYGGGQGDTEIRIHLQESGAGKELAKAAGDDDLILQIKKSAASENQILLYVHEFFHTFQQHAWCGWDKGEGDRRFAVNTEYAGFSEIEGRALEAAYNAKSKKEAREYLKDYITARDLKQTHMTPGAIMQEKYTNLTEGLAVYAETSMAKHLRDKGIKPKADPALDPFFMKYRFMDEYVTDKTTRGIGYLLDLTLDNGLKYYTYGCLEAYVLDRLSRKWKKGFMQKETDTDDVVRRLLKLSDKDKASIAERLKTRYPYEEIFAKHGKVVKERDDALALIDNRKGRKYTLDWKATKEFFILIHKEGTKEVRMGVKVIMKEGFQPFTLGEIELTSGNCLIYQPGIWGLEWVDPKPEEGKGFDLKFEKKDGDVYKKAVITTGGFTLKAPEVRIEETPGEVKFIILSKVTR